MPIGYHLEKSLGLTIVVWDGNVTGADAEEHVRELQIDSDWPPGPLHLLDSTSATSVPAIASTKLVDMAVGAAAPHHIRFALVADHGFEEATRFQRAASSKGLSRVIVFNELSTACTWLGVDLSTVRTLLDAMRRELRERDFDEPPRSE